MSTPNKTFMRQWGDQQTTDNKLKNTPLVSNAYKAFTDAFDKLPADAAKGDAEATGIDVTSVASDVTGFAMDATQAASDPLGFLISKGLGFLENVFLPLKEILQLVTGDPTTLANCAQNFDKMAGSLNQLASGVQESALSGGQNWFGEAAAAAGQQVGGTKRSIEDTATAAGHIATLLQISSMLMQAAYDIVNGIIAGVVEQVVITWIAAQAAAAFTFGGSELAAVTETGEATATGVAQASEKTEEASGLLIKIMNLLKRIMAKIKEIGGNLKHPLKSFMTGEGKGAKALKDIETDGKTGKQIFSEAMNKNLGKTITDKAREKTLAEFGLPTKDPSEMKPVEVLQAGTNLAGKAWSWGDQTGKAIAYGADPGAYSQYKDGLSGADTSTTAPAEPAPTEPQPAEPKSGGQEPIPNWPAGEPDGSHIEPV